jgi:Tol biopolymer transport system component
MGEVYRACDVRLARDVAIKILPRTFTGDSDRLARFEREARVLASLNHPHIGAIYGLEESGGTRALVLELVEGDTLEERIARGLPQKEALAIARQIGDALDAAHEKGIVHRDLKPSNIKITPDGTVKVLDFGLAKLTSEERAPDMSQSPTLTVAGTREGVILGTVAYMSPEQARGRAVDKRTDIWAFGCVVYEMLTGRRAFGRETVSDTLAAILEREPDYSALPRSLPVAGGRLLRRCLAKDPRQRLRDIGDAELAVLDGESPDSSGRPTRRQWPLAFALVTMSVMAAALVLTWLYWPRTSSAEAVSERGSLERVTYDSGVTRMPRFAPDGRLLVFASDRAGQNNLDIWVQQVSGGAPHRLTDDPADDSMPQFSPDGNQIVFRSERGGGGIYIVPALGGTARLIAPDGRGPRFSPDGTRISYWTGSSRSGASGVGAAAFVVPMAGGAPVRLLSDFANAREPVWSPDGRSVVILARRDSTSRIEEALDWWWVSLAGGSPVKTGVLDLPGLRAAEAAPEDWTASGVLFSDGTNLWSIPISESSGTITRGPTQLTFGTGRYADSSMAHDGTLAFAALTEERVIERVQLEDHQPKNVARLYSDGQGNARRASTTLDGSMVAFERNLQSRSEIWLKNLRTGQQTMLLSVDAPGATYATISQDGARVAYTVPDSAAATSGRGFVVETSGGLPKQICERCGLRGFLRDSRRVLAETSDGKMIRLYDIASGASQTVISATRGGLDRPHVSPDDRWIAFRQTDKTFVTRFTPDQPPEQEEWARVEEPTTTGRPMGWSPQSDVVYLLLDTDGFRCVYGQRTDTRSGALQGTPYPVVHFHGNDVVAAGVSTSFGNAVSTEGFVYEAVKVRSDIWKLILPSNEEGP